jgi:hypothetical protein
MAHVEKIDVSDPLSVGPPRIATKPTKTLKEKIQPMAHFQLAMGSSNQVVMTETPWPS